MRIFQVAEQVVEDGATKLRLEFSSIHTDELNAGNEAPSHDGLVVLRLWTSDRARVAAFLFERSGRFIKTDVEPAAQSLDDPLEPAVTVQGDGGDETHHWTHPINPKPTSVSAQRDGSGDLGFGRPASFGV